MKRLLISLIALFGLVLAAGAVMITSPAPARADAVTGHFEGQVVLSPILYPPPVTISGTETLVDGSQQSVSFSFMPSSTGKAQRGACLVTITPLPGMPEILPAGEGMLTPGNVLTVQVTSGLHRVEAVLQLSGTNVGSSVTGQITEIKP